MNEEEITPTLEDWIKALAEAAEDTLEKIPTEKNKDYIKKETCDQIEEKMHC